MVKILTNSFEYFRLDPKFYFIFKVFDVFEKWYELDDRPN